MLRNPINVGLKSNEFLRGKVKWFDEKRGYGFILDNARNEYFVHISKVKGNVYLKTDQRVRFKTIKAFKGTQACEVEIDD